MKYKVTLKGRTYEVEVEAGEAILLDEYEAIAPSAPAAAPAAAAPAAAPAPAAAAAPAAPAVTGAGDPVNAPMPGNILKVNVSQGQAVKSGDVLCVLEAMKMENEIMAPKDGTVTQVLVSKGSTVDTGAPLVVIG
ncbi:MAG: biotin/lipoyl-containing protein [Candidatus Faecousia sp.]|nr:biotin/lipoyl-containing protein [Candidatus Faecousia sp.]